MNIIIFYRCGHSETFQDEKACKKANIGYSVPAKKKDGSDLNAKTYLQASSEQYCLKCSNR